MDVNFALLNDETLIILEGRDSRSFLQGQSTCDVDQLSCETALPGLLCSPKGKVLTDFLLVDIEKEKIGLRVKRDLVETTCANLGKYAIFSKIKIYDESDYWQIIGIWGSDASQLVYNLTRTKITEKYAVANGNNVKAIQLDEQGEHYELILNSESIDYTNKELLKFNEKIEERWAEELIKLGICRLSLETTDQHVPQVLNYDLTDFISFKKGCYTGQEIIARLKYRGTPKRRSMLATCEAQEGIMPGGTIFCINSDVTKGVIINAALDSDGRSFSLLVSLPKLKENSEIRALNETGPKLNLDALPYKVTFENS